MSGKKKGLGRGLSALFGDEKPKDQRQDIKKRDWERDQGRILKKSKK